MTTLLIATRNDHKVGEIRSILGEHLRYLTLKDFPPAPSVREDADTFAGNATKKATELAAWLHLHQLAASIQFVLADDSGLEVDALDGAPGVHSARFAALDHIANRPDQNSGDADNNAKLLRLLKDVPLDKRSARFRCVIVLIQIHPPSRIQFPQIFNGACEGHIEFAPRGRGGFGYDPLFVPTGFSQSFAELGEDTKNQISHRAQALAKLRTSFQ